MVGVAFDFVAYRDVFVEAVGAVKLSVRQEAKRCHRDAIEKKQGDRMVDDGTAH